MKRSYKIWITGCFIALLCSSIQAIPPQLEISVRGAVNKEELTEALFQAVKSNGFDMLLNYLPDEHHLEILKLQSSEVEKGLYDNLDSDTIKINTKNNFEQIIKAGIDKGVNWSSLQLMENKPKNKNYSANLITTILIAQDDREIILSFSYDAIEIGQRWFIFQGIRTENDKSTIGYNE
jgi:hypothetical protein